MEAKRVTWPKTGIIHWCFENWEWASTLQKSLIFLLAFKNRHSRAEVGFSIRVFDRFYRYLFSNFQRNMEIWEKSTIFACSVQTAIVTVKLLLVSCVIHVSIICQVRVGSKEGHTLPYRLSSSCHSSAQNLRKKPQPWFLILSLQS